ncbi:H-2 class II histocompatibility antigen, E-S beta chain-like [Elgaria multicarinata webbii]|uniref:H-2 class II histocompatibility antigen, E-S beta chain-like n=1 Tax=Elgaria multicarinata webbii TaxID=159646 RepID=UPI002FCCC91B
MRSLVWVTILLVLLGPSLLHGSAGRNTLPVHFLAQCKAECRFSKGRPPLQVRYLLKYIYDGQEIARFDSDLGRFLAVSPLGAPIAKDWNSQEALLAYYQSMVDHFCWNNYKTAEAATIVSRTVQPTITISPTNEDPTSPNTLLLCIVTGYYPLEIKIRWLKNGLEQKEGVFYGEELQNGDWTYQTQVMLEMTPEYGDVYTCQVEHVSLEVPITVQWEPWMSVSAKIKIHIGVTAVVSGLLFAAVGFSCYLKNKKGSGLGDGFML